MGCNSFWSNNIVFNQNRIASVITALMLMIGLRRAIARVLARLQRAPSYKILDSNVKKFGFYSLEAGPVITGNAYKKGYVEDDPDS